VKVWQMDQVCCAVWQTTANFVTQWLSNRGYNNNMGLCMNANSGLLMTRHTGGNCNNAQ